jgi:flagellar motor protein MotB
MRWSHPLDFRNRKFPEHDEESGVSSKSGWQVVYTGFVLIMLCFFIMLSSLSNLEATKVTRFVASFNRALSIFTGGTKVDPGDLVLPDSPDVVDQNADLARLYDELRQVVQILGDAAAMEVVMTSEGVRLRVNAPVLFQSGQADLIPEARPLLTRVASLVAGTALLNRRAYRQCPHPHGTLPVKLGAVHSPGGPGVAVFNRRGGFPGQSLIGGRTWVLPSH